MQHSMASLVHCGRTTLIAPLVSLLPLQVHPSGGAASITPVHKYAHRLGSRFRPFAGGSLSIRLSIQHTWQRHHHSNRTCAGADGTSGRAKDSGRAVSSFSQSDASEPAPSQPSSNGTGSGDSGKADSVPSPAASSQRLPDGNDPARIGSDSGTASRRIGGFNARSYGISSSGKAAGSGISSRPQRQRHGSSGAQNASTAGGQYSKASNAKAGRLQRLAERHAPADATSKSQQQQQPSPPQASNTAQPQPEQPPAPKQQWQAQQLTWDGALDSAAEQSGDKPVKVAAKPSRPPQRKRSGPSLRSYNSPHGMTRTSSQLDRLVQRYMEEDGAAGGQTATAVADDKAGGRGDGKGQSAWWQQGFGQQMMRERKSSSWRHPPPRPRVRKHVIGYVDRQLRSPENRTWKAAGALVYMFDRQGELLILLGRPDYSGEAVSQRTRAHKFAWNLLGGKRERRDQSAERTAWREMKEESGGLLREEDLEGEADTVVWYPGGKYALFPRKVEGQEDLPQRFAAWKRRQTRRTRKGPRPTLDLAWVPLAVVLDPATSMRRHMVLKTLLKQPTLLTWLMQQRAEYRASLNLPPLFAEVPAAEPVSEESLSDDELESDAEDSEDEEEQMLEGEEAEEEELLTEEELQDEPPLPVVWGVDESKYGLPELLPLGVLVALEETEIKRRPLPAKMRPKLAQQLWREDVAAAAAGSPTPIVDVPAWKPPKSLELLRGPGDVVVALAAALFQTVPVVWQQAVGALMTLENETWDLQLTGIPLRDAEAINGTAHIVYEIKRIQVVWQMRYVMSLLGRGVSPFPVMTDVILDYQKQREADAPADPEAAEGMAAADDAAATAESRQPQEAESAEGSAAAAAKDDANVSLRSQIWQGRLTEAEVLNLVAETDTTPEQVEVRARMREGFEKLLLGRVSDAAVHFPNTTEGNKAVQTHILSQPSEDIGVVLQCALVGLRRRNGQVEGPPSSLFQLARVLVSELLVTADDAEDVLTTVFGGLEGKKAEERRAAVAKLRSDARLDIMLTETEAQRRKQQASRKELLRPATVRRFQEALIKEKMRDNDLGKPPVALPPQLAERMTAAYLRSKARDDPLGAMKDPETDLQDMTIPDACLEGGGIPPAGGGKSKGQSKKPDAEVARSAEPTASLDWLAKVADEIAEAAPDDGVERWDLRSELGTQMAQAVHKGSVARWCEVWWHTNKLAAMLDTANSSISGARQRTTIIIGGVIAQEEALRMNALLTVRRILQVTQPTMPLDSLRQVVLDIPLPSENAAAESTPQGGSGLWGNMQKAVQGIKKAVDGKASALLSQPVLDAIKRLRSGDVDWDQDYVLVDDQKFLVHISKLPKETVRLVLRAAMDGMFTLQRKKVGDSQAMPAWDTAEETEMLLRYLLQGNPEYDRHFVNAGATGTTMGDAQARLDAALYDLATYKLPEDPKQQKGGKSGSKKRSGGKKGGGSKAAASSKGFGKKK